MCHGAPFKACNDPTRTVARLGEDDGSVWANDRDLTNDDLFVSQKVVE